MQKVYLLLISLLPLSFLQAQRYYPSGIQSREKVSFGFGSSTYSGDLQETRTLASTLNLMMSYEYQLNPRFSVRGDGVIYQIKGSDANAVSAQKRERNLSFYATNFEVSGSLMLFLFRQLPADYRNRRIINVYGLLGFGVTHFNPKTAYKGHTYELRDYTTEGVNYGSFAPLIPSGFGLEVKVSQKFNLAVEATYRYTFTDYLDDVSTLHQDPASFTSEIAAGLSDRRQELGLPPQPAGTMRGNSEVKDGYGLLNFRLIYFIDRVYYQAKDKKKKLKR